MSINNPTITSYRDAFLIDTTYIRRLNLDWPDGGGVVGGTYGWFGNGDSGAGIVSSITRIDFSNDSPTVSTVRSPAGIVAIDRAAIGNQNYGWFGGGYNFPSSFSRIDRIDFANDSPASASVRGLLTSEKGSLSAVSNNNYGWFAGGGPAIAPAYLSTVDRINFANDSPSTAGIRGPLAIAKRLLAATANSAYGWFGGGINIPGPSVYSFVERIDFSNDSPTAASRRGNLPDARYGLTATGNANFGWFGGGTTGTPFFSTIYRIDFSNDSPSSASPRGPLSLARFYLSATGNANYGWFSGGQTGPTFTVYSTVDRIDFANDSPASTSVRGALSGTRSNHSATSNYVKTVPGTIYPTQGFSSNQFTAGYGWFAGGNNPSVTISSIDRIDFANDSPQTASIRGTLPQERYGAGGSANSNYGFVGGGFVSSAANSNISRIDFANDSPTSTLIRGNLSTARAQLSATGNANYGWFGGGVLTTVPNTPVSTVDRIDYANDSPTSAIFRSPLALARQRLTAVGNADYGWFGGGYFTSIPSIQYSTVDRIEFANDSPASASPRGVLPQVMQLQGSTSNANFGWFGAGRSNPGVAISTVYRIDFSNDSPASASTRGPLTLAIEALSATGNANFGWFTGGSSPTRSTVDRIDFANDSPTTASPRGLLSVAKDQHTSISNYVKPSLNQQHLQQPFFGGPTDGTFGWVGGGRVDFPLRPISSVDRIDFANDSPTSASSRGLLALASSTLAAIGNANYGWFGGGYLTGPSKRSSVQRIDFANDSNTATLRGEIDPARDSLAAVSNNNYGWFGGGFTSGVGSAVSTISRVDFANDSPTTASPRGPLSAATYELAAAGNNNYGWYGGGRRPSIGEVSIVLRIDFSNDSPAASSVRGPLLTTRPFLAALSNTNYGWFVGGGSPLVSSRVERVDFANDSPTAASPRGNAGGVTSSGLAATGNANFGWFSGGDPVSSALTSVFRIEFANDLAAASTRGNLTSGRNRGAGTSNYVKVVPTFNIPQYFKGSGFSNSGAGTFGWFTGGTPGSGSTIDRIDFSNDSPTTSSSRGSLATGRINHAGTSNANYGWFAGGTPGPLSSVDRIDFANDSPTTGIIRGPLTQIRTSLAACGNKNYGWWGGGNPGPGPVSIIDRIDFSNDSPVSASRRGPLTLARQFLAATANNNYGWFGGGYAPVSARSTVDRIDFANDSPTSTSPRGPLSQARPELAATGNANFGWFGGGFGTSFPVVNRSTVDRINFANDSPTSANARGPLVITRRNTSCTGNANYGWWAGAFPAISAVDRVDFANDSPTTASPRGFLSAGRSSMAGTSNYTK